MAHASDDRWWSKRPVFVQSAVEAHSLCNPRLHSRHTGDLGVTLLLFPFELISFLIWLFVIVIMMSRENRNTKSNVMAKCVVWKYPSRFLKYTHIRKIAHKQLCVWDYCENVQHWLFKLLVEAVWKCPVLFKPNPGVEITHFDVSMKLFFVCFLRETFVILLV